MTAQIYERVNNQIPTIADFWWNADGTPISYTIDGDEYPYQHQVDGITRASDYRYEILTTPISAPVAFDAVGAANPSHPKVVTPPGVSIIQYLWNFGDGTIGYGPQPSHTYSVASPDTQVSLTVTDSRGFLSSCTKFLNLIT